jgi:hypothetical protein
VESIPDVSSFACISTCHMFIDSLLYSWLHAGGVAFREITQGQCHVSRIDKLFCTVKYYTRRLFHAAVGVPLSSSLYLRG